MTYGLYTEQTAKSIHDVVLGPQSVQTDTEGLYDDNYEPIWFLVKMTETLRYADSDETKPEETGQRTAKGNTVTLTSDSTSNDYEENTVEGAEITVTTRDHNIFIAKGDYIWCREIDDAVVPIANMRTDLDAVLTQSLSKATNSLTDPAQAICKILHPTGSKEPEASGWSSLAVTTWEETVINRFTDISIVAGTYITIRRINGEWRPITADCSDSGIDHTAGDDTLL